jgi:hypothetical protein
MACDMFAACSTMLKSEGCLVLFTSMSGRHFFPIMVPTGKVPALVTLITLTYINNYMSYSLLRVVNLYVQQSV